MMWNVYSFNNSRWGSFLISVFLWWIRGIKDPTSITLFQHIFYLEAIRLWIEAFTCNNELLFELSAAACNTMLCVPNWKVALSN